jgi:hypothetical protein
MFWWALDALRHCAVDPRNMWIAEPRLLIDCGTPSSLGVFPDVTFQTAFTKLTPLNKGIVDSGAALWRKFGARSPLSFDAARRNRVAAFPDLNRISNVYGAVFPQLVGRRLRLSEFDQALFDAAQPDLWLRPVDLLKKNHERIEIFLLFGQDRLFLRRLQEWAAHSPGAPALLARAEQWPKSEFTAVSYRLTPRGERFCEEGLETLVNAPTMYIGGCCLYARKPAWVRRNRGGQWWIERLQR